MKRTIWALTLMFLGAACTGSDGQAGKPAAPFAHDWSAYGRLLRAHVTEGRVSYGALQADRAALDSLVAAIATANLSVATDKQKLAFYINAYNILTLRSVVDHYPVGSIREIAGVWDKTQWPVAGSRITLNHLEHEILRKDFAEPRIHFALVCASVGCPPLTTVPYDADSLDRQLEQAAQGFVRDDTRNHLDPAAGTAELSAIFDWFGGDFINEYHNPAAFPSLSEKENAVLNFVINHHPEGDRAHLRSAGYQITYREYDWSLNVTP